MVRLVVLSIFLPVFLAACSGLPKTEGTQGSSIVLTEENLDGIDIDGNDLEGMENSEEDNSDLAHLDEGEHHPAVKALLIQAEKSRVEGNSRQALSYLDRARQIQPRNADIFYRQAWLNYQLGNMSQTKQLLQRATVFLRKSVANYDQLQRRIQTLQQKVEANEVFN